MKNLTKLFRLLEITRSMPQYGYALAEIPKGELSDLAQHHYLVTIFAWQLARLVKRAGGKIDIEKVLEFALIHDLGEIFGGDISMPYAKANPVARAAAKRFEAENHKYLATFFGDDAPHFRALAEEILDAKSDEAIVAKLADYLEVNHYKVYVRRLTKQDTAMVVVKMHDMLAKLHDPIAKKALNEFVDKWEAEFGSGTIEELFEQAKGE